MCKVNVYKSYDELLLVCAMHNMNISASTELKFQAMKSFPFHNIILASFIALGTASSVAQLQDPGAAGSTS